MLEKTTPIENSVAPYRRGRPNEINAQLGGVEGANGGGEKVGKPNVGKNDPIRK